MCGSCSWPIVKEQRVGCKLSNPTEVAETCCQPPLEKCPKCNNNKKERQIFLIPLKGTCLCNTVRHMRYRAFLKWYYGAHQQEWGKLAIIVLFFTSGAVTSFGDHVSGTEGYWWTGYGIIFSIIFTIFVCAIFFLRIPLFVGRWSARISLVYICFSVVTFISILTNRVTTRVAKSTTMSRMIIAKSAVPESSGAVLLPKKFFLYVSISFFALQIVNFLVGIFYSTVVFHIAEYYYLKSSLFLSHWTLYSIEPIQLLVPSLAIAEKQRYLKALKEKNGPINVASVTRPISCHFPLFSGHQEEFPLETFLQNRKKTVSCEPLRISVGLRIECSQQYHCFDHWKFFAYFNSLEIFSRISCFCRNFCFQRFCKLGQRWKTPRVPYPFKNKRFYRRVTFIGETDEYGQPWGFGSWSDDGDNYGERLIGYWYKGLPDGPHKSREAGTGSGFMCIRIGWGKYSLSDDHLSFGISNVECSVSGKFYKHYPLVTFQEPPSSGVDPEPSFAESAQGGTEDMMTVEKKTAENLSDSRYFPPGPFNMNLSRPSPMSLESVEKGSQTILDRTETAKLGFCGCQIQRPIPQEGCNADLEGTGDTFSRPSARLFKAFISPSDTNINFFLNTQTIAVQNKSRECSFSTQPFNPEKNSEKRNKSALKDFSYPPVSLGALPNDSCDTLNISVKKVEREKESRFSATEATLRKIGKTALSMPHQVISKKAATTLANSTVFRRRKQKSLCLLPWYYKTQRHVMWCLMKLCPHTPNFGVQSRCELVIGVDRERGVYIGGYASLTNFDIINKMKFDEYESNPSLYARSKTFSVSRSLDDGDETPLQTDPECSIQQKQILTKKRSLRDLEGMKRRRVITLRSHISGKDINARQVPQFDINSDNFSLKNRLGYLLISIVQRPLIYSGDFNEAGAPIQSKKSENFPDISSNLCKCISSKEAQIVDLKHECSGVPIKNKLTLMMSDANIGSDTLSEALPHNEKLNSKNSHSPRSQIERVYRPNPSTSKLDPWDSRFHNLVPVLEPEGWVCLDTAGSAEVLLYIHGFNNSQIESLQILGQMAAFGNFPNHIRLFLFSWPAGSSVWQFFSAFRAAENPKTHAALFNMLNLLSDSGIQGIHILCHSMGSRLFLRSFSSVCRLFRKVNRNDSTNPTAAPLHTTSCMQLLTVTFLNPEYYLEDFVQKDYAKLRQYCNHITIFADAKDKALMWFECFSGRVALGKTVFGIWAPCSFSSKSSDLLPLNIKPPLHFLNTVSFFHFSSVVETALGEDGRELNDEDIEWLDVDVIDTTFMDQNVHNLRHSFWSLNREIIEDIRELMITRKRARQRTGRLDRRDGNVWVYRVAPAFLTSLFEMSI